MLLTWSITAIPPLPYSMLSVLKPGKEALHHSIRTFPLNLGFTKSLHAVLGYDYLIGTNFRLKLETYYQYLYNIPVTNVTDFEGHDMFSMINAGDYFAVPSVDSMITLDLKSILAGGKRYIPILEAESLAQNEAVDDWDKAYEQKYDAYFRIDFRIGFKRNGKRMNEEYALDLQNLTNHKNIFLQTWDADNGSIRTDYQTGFYPMMLYRVNF
jgi:hypothetical protein